MRRRKNGEERINRESLRPGACIHRTQLLHQITRRGTSHYSGSIRFSCRTVATCVVAMRRSGGIGERGNGTTVGEKVRQMSEFGCSREKRLIGGLGLVVVFGTYLPYYT